MVCWTVNVCMSEASVMLRAVRFVTPVKDQTVGFVGVKTALVVSADTECEKVLTASAGCC